MITIAIPFYNAEKYLLHAIQSVFAQTYQDWILLLVDDGSTDASLSIANTINDSRVEVVSDGINYGLAYRLNQIAHLAKTPFLARMDADDLMHPERIERQLQFLIENPDVDLVDTSVIVIDENKYPIALRALENLSFDPITILERSLLVHPSVAGKTKWFIDNPYDVNQNRCQDKELWLRTYKTSCFKRIRIPLHYKDESNTFSLRTYSATSKESNRLIRYYGPKLVGYPITVYILIKARMKVEILKLMCKLKIVDSLIKLRHEAIDQRWREHVETGLKIIFESDIPIKK